mmetsp:Transcript_41127/g.128960  ORF Transcript_41127/g.128960 Transcript_41127/m.128960 type:complete len:262 (-) Transcript_41127:289-1074(-)
MLQPRAALAEAVALLVALLGLERLHRGREQRRAGGAVHNLEEAVAQRREAEVLDDALEVRGGRVARAEHRLLHRRRRAPLERHGLGRAAPDHHRVQGRREVVDERVRAGLIAHGVVEVDDHGVPPRRPGASRGLLRPGHLPQRTLLRVGLPGVERVGESAAPRALEGLLIAARGELRRLPEHLVCDVAQRQRRVHGREGERIEVRVEPDVWVRLVRVERAGARDARPQQRVLRRAERQRVHHLRARHRRAIQDGHGGVRQV